jgi:hypothetical protein
MGEASPSTQALNLKRGAWARARSAVVTGAVSAKAARATNTSETARSLLIARSILVA